jgi:predicted small integral membrane protein
VDVLVLRLSRLAGVVTVALFFTLVALGNLTDPGGNWPFVQHVLAMDTTFGDSRLMWRAITEPWLQRLAFGLIILCQVATAVLLWIGVVRLGRTLRADRPTHLAARSWAITGLTLGLLLYGLGFIVIGGEWFAMWQSQTWNGQDKAAIFVLLIGLTLLHLTGPES